MTMSERILIMVKDKVVLKERDAWSDLANFIGEMVVKYAESMDLDNLPDPYFYLRKERIRQLYTELYKEKNITQFRNTKISIERKVTSVTGRRKRRIPKRTVCCLYVMHWRLLPNSF